MTVALVDDDPAVLDSLRMLLASHGVVVAGYERASDFLKHEKAHPHSCVVSDIRMPSMSGTELLTELRARGNLMPVILITGHGDVAMAVAALKNGAFDFIEKPFDEDRLVDSIRSAIASAAKVKSDQDEIADLAVRMAQLSERQRQVLDLVVQGLSNKEIAIALGISHRTVENYRAWVMEKMGAGNLADLVRKAIKLDRSTP